MENWARKIVSQCNNVMETEDTTFILLTTSKRQLKFLHLQQQCYWDCPFCEKEAMEYLRQKKEV